MVIRGGFTSVSSDEYNLSCIILGHEWCRSTQLLIGVALLLLEGLVHLSYNLR
jgi:hypothetical protein